MIHFGSKTLYSDIITSKCGEDLLASANNTTDRLDSITCPKCLGKLLESLYDHAGLTPSTSYWD